MNRAPSKCRPLGIAAALAAALSWIPGSHLRADLSPVGSEILRQGPAGTVAGTAASFDYLGFRAVVADFDGDGFEDLAATERETTTERGSVHVLYGGADGLSDDDDQLWQDLDPDTLLLDREPGDLFGWALAAGDFDGDELDDLAIGVPGETIDDPTGPDVVHGGVVLVIYGSSLGLQLGTEPGTRAPRRFQLGSGGIGGGPPTAEESFGSVLAAADFSGDGYDDLAVGIPEDASSSAEGNAGSVLVIYGGAAGLTGTGHAFLNQDSDIGGNPMLGSTGVADFFGAALAAGDFNLDGEADLAIGVPGETDDVPGDLPAAGAVQIVYGTAGGGLVTAGNQLWHEANVLAGGSPGFDDEFGSVLAAGDLTGDGAADLVIAAPQEDLGAISDAGAITFLIGVEGIGISTPGSEIFFEEDFPVSSNPENNDEFGRAIAIGDFVADIVPGRLDLAIGTPLDNVWNGASNITDVGSVVVTIGGLGLGPSSATLWAPGRDGVAGSTTSLQSFGAALAAGDFDGDGHGDLAVGAPWASQPSFSEDGALFVLRGALFADGLESHTTARWSSTAP